MILTHAAILVSTTALLVAAPPSEQELGAAARRLLDLAEHKSPSGTTGAAAVYRQLKQAVPDDARVEYVCAVALVNQHKIKNALPLVERYLAAHPSDAAATRTCVWALLQERRYDEALAGTVRLAHLAAAQAEDEARPTARFLGTVYGYLELARPEAVDEQVRSAKKVEVLGTLGDDLIATFDQGRQDVRARIADIDAEIEQQQEKLVEKIEQERKATEEMLKEDAQKISVSKETLDTSGEELRDAQRQLVVIRQQLASLMADRARLSSQIAATQAQLLQQQEILGTPDEDQNTPRPGIMNISARRLAAAAIAQRLSIALAALNKQAFDLDRKALALRADGQQLGGKSFEEAEAIANSQDSLQQAEKRTKALERRAKQLERKKPRVAGRALAAQKQALATYLPFPYDEEKQRVLDWFAMP